LSSKLALTEDRRSSWGFREIFLSSDEPRNLQNLHIDQQNVRTTPQWPSVELSHWIQNGSANLTLDTASGLPITRSIHPRRLDTTYITSLRSGWFDYPAQEVADNSIAAWSFKSAGLIAKSLT